MSGFRRAAARRRRASDDAVVATFAPFEVSLLRQFARELILLLQAEAGAGQTQERDDDAIDEFAAITAMSGLGDTASSGPVARPEDPVIARLFPDAYGDDDESAADFRRFTQDRLVEGKYGSAQAMLAMLPDEVDEDDVVEIALDQSSALQWLGTLNDIRLALGVRLGVKQDDDQVWAALPDDDPRGTVHEIYDWLGWVQDTLVSSLPRPRAGGAR
jgi:hypothetical protein